MFPCFFQANVLGKGVSHIAGDMSHAGGEPSVYSVSNLIRKLRLEDAGTALKPTPARAQVPAEYQDGILNFCVQPLNTTQASAGPSRPSTATKPSQQQQANIVVASKTKLVAFLIKAEGSSNCCQNRCQNRCQNLLGVKTFGQDLKGGKLF